ncbi:flagellar protein FlaG [Oceanobacillus manasiensis]|uniref:flagellar protein FlaG n=1 Tax=Oceanobacillus manasiensis TaxID=586413 RepID=UPI0005AAC1E5|nr:flagellar protein FlaG [Oceanobacillus manasiensis]
MRIDNVVNTSLPLLSSENNKTIAPEIDRKSETNNFLPEFNRTDIEKAADTLNELMKPLRTNLKFELHDKLEKYYVSVVDSETNEVIKEIPPKKFLDMYANMAEFMGILIDKKI